MSDEIINMNNRKTCYLYIDEKSNRYYYYFESLKKLYKHVKIIINKYNDIKAHS